MQPMQGLGVDELVDAEFVCAIERGAELLALGTAEELQLPHPLHLELEQALVLRRASLRAWNDGPGRAERRRQLCKLGMRHEALLRERCTRSKRQDGCEGAKDGPPHGNALPLGRLPDCITEP